VPGNRSTVSASVAIAPNDPWAHRRTVMTRPLPTRAIENAFRRVQGGNVEAAK